MDPKDPVVQSNYYDGLAAAIDRVAAMLLQNAEVPGSPAPTMEALQELQSQLAQLRLGKEKGAFQEEFVAFSAADAVLENLHYKQLMENVSIPYITTDIHGEVRKANPVAAEAFNLCFEDSKGLPLVSCVAKSSRGSFRKALEQLKDGRATFIPSLFFQHRNGEEPVEYGAHAIPVLVAGSDHTEIDWLLAPVVVPVKIAARQAIGNDVLSMESITDSLLQDGEEFTNGELQTFRGYAATHKNLSEAVDVADLLDSTVSEIANLIGEYCFLSVLSPDRRNLIPTAAATNKDGSDEVIRHYLESDASLLSDNFAKKVVQTQLPWSISNETPTETHLDQMFGEGPVNMLMIPLRAGKTSLGLLTLVRDGAARPYQDYEVLVTQNLADHVGLILRYLDSAAYLRDPAAESLHAAFLEEVCTELQASLHPLYGYVEMLKERAQELKLRELEDEVALVVKTAAYSNRILADAYEIVQIDSGVRKPTVESHPVDYLIGEIIGLIRHSPGVDEILFERSAHSDETPVQTDLLWAGQIVQKVMGCLSCKSAIIQVTAEREFEHISFNLKCANGLFAHQLTGHSCVVDSRETQKLNRPIYKKGVAMNLAQRLSDKLGAKISYSSDEVSFETVTFSFPLKATV